LTERGDKSGYHSASFERGPDFNSRPEDLLYRQTFFVLFLSSSRKILGLHLKIGHDLPSPFSEIQGRTHPHIGRYIVGAAAQVLLGNRC